MTDEIKEQVEEKVVNPADRSNLTIQKFMDDMSMLGAQVKNPALVKPTFHYGDASVTNYMLWLILAELMMLNDNLEGD